jgi:hypothetical protein
MMHQKCQNTGGVAPFFDWYDTVKCYSRCDTGTVRTGNEPFGVTCRTLCIIACNSCKAYSGIILIHVTSVLDFCFSSAGVSETGKKKRATEASRLLDDEGVIHMLNRVPSVYGILPPGPAHSNLARVQRAR